MNKIDAEERRRATEQARPKHVPKFDASANVLSRPQREALRHRLRELQCNPADELRARQLLAMLDGYEDASHFEDRVSEVLDEANTEGLKDDVARAISDINEAFSVLKPEKLTEQIPKTIPPEFKARIVTWHTKQLETLKAQIVSAMKPITEGAEALHNVLEKLSEPKK